MVAGAIWLALAAALPAAAATGPCFEDWWRTKLDEARALRRDPSALLPLREVIDTGRTAADPDAVRSGLESVRALPDTHPLVAAEIDSVLLEEDLERGDFAAAAERRQRLGLVTSFVLAGPFKGPRPPTDLWDGFDPLKPDPARWRTIETGPGGALPLHELMTPASESTAVAMFHVRFARPTTVAIRYSADDRATLEIDGEGVLDPAGRRDMGFDQHVAFVELQPGWRRVALVVGQETGVWALQVRLTMPDGRPLVPGEATVAPLPDAPSPPRDPRKPSFARVSGASATEWFERQAQKSDPLARARLAEDLASRNLPERNESRALTLARAAAADAPANIEVQWVAAMVETDPARRRETYERILQLSPTHPAALRRLAGYYLEYGRPDDALEVARRTLSACGGADPYVQGWEALARDGRGFPAGAAAAIERLLEAHPRQAALWGRLADLLRREGLVARARRAYERLLALEQMNDRVRQELIGMLSASGDVDEAIRLVEAGLRFDPLDISLRRRLIRLLLDDGQTERARGELSAALALSPGQTELLELEGEALLAAGDEHGAATTWRSALAATQDPGGLGDRIAALTGADDSFGAEWAVAVEEAREIEKAKLVEGDPAAVVLSKTVAYRVRADGLATQFHQMIIRVRRPDEADFSRSVSFSYSPTLERPTVVAARLIRRDGAVVLAARRDTPMLPDPEIRMWYDTRIVDLTFPRLEEGDLIDVRWRLADRGPTNPLGEGYFGDFWSVGESIPVLSARLIYEASDSLPLAHRVVNSATPPTVRTERRDAGTITVIEWSSVPAQQGEPLAPPPSANAPYVTLGSTTDWGRVGRIYGRLIRDQAVAGPDIQDLVRSLTAKSSSRRETIRVIYNWVIENTRYVALELGIHALKPYDAPSVLRRRFGDCKDKATLMVTMLREAGVAAEVALVRTRDRGPLDPTVPTLAAFDHAIVHVPGDELWLDGTVMHHALGEVPAMDRNILALLVDASGEKDGRLVTVPEMTPADSSVVRTENITLDADGDATIGVEVVARGDAAGHERAYFRRRARPASVLAERLRQEFPDVTLIRASFEKVDLDDDEVRYRFDVAGARFARREGDALSAPLGLASPGLPLQRPALDRRLPIELPPPFHGRMESRIAFPPGYSIRESPARSVVESPWGRVEVDVRVTRREAVIVVDVQFLGGLVPVDRTPELAAFVERAQHALDGRLVLAAAVDGP